MMATAGYSKTPLFKKLGIKENYLIKVYYAPKNYMAFFSDFPEGVQIIETAAANESIDFIHIFATTAKELSNVFLEAKSSLKKNGILWISWPKKTSKIPSEIDKFFVMNYGKDNGLVDVKVAAIDNDWSGHKFVYRVKER